MQRSGSLKYSTVGWGSGASQLCVPSFLSWIGPAVPRLRQDCMEGLSTPLFNHLVKVKSKYKSREEGRTSIYVNSNRNKNSNSLDKK